MPWPVFNRPSIQLGTLKAYLQKSASDWLDIETRTPYLEVAAILGTDIYHWVSQNIWVSEALYAPLLFPEQKQPAHSLMMKYLRRAAPDIRKKFPADAIHEKLSKQLENWVSACDWSMYDLIGFSVCFNQLLATLAAARFLKNSYPGLPIVLGGSTCAAATGKTYLEAFNFVDFVIPGEGEESLLELCRHISGRRHDLPGNIVASQKNGQPAACPSDAGTRFQITSLDSLPPPDFDDYMAEQKKWFHDRPFIPTLPVEFSRGCWWNKCTFCNLNLQWCGYRSKTAEQMLQEITCLSSRYGTLDFTFTDNMLPPQESQQLFTMTEKLPVDLNFFAEIRVPGRGEKIGEVVNLYKRGGLSTVQVGIESLSSSLLKKMKKGTGVMENIAVMRAAHEHSLSLEGNLIVQFPGSTQDEVDETLENLAYVFPYPPLAAAVFFLGYDCPVYHAPGNFNIRAIVNHSNNRRLFPKKILGKLLPIVMDYRGDKTHQKTIWEPVVARIKDWQLYHEKRKVPARHRPLLSYRDGGDFLLIRQELIGEILHHRLKGSSRGIYLYCTRIRSEEEIFEKFPTIPKERLLAFLADLTKKRLVFSEKNRYIALAVRHRG